MNPLNKDEQKSLNTFFSILVFPSSVLNSQADFTSVLVGNFTWVLETQMENVF